MGTTQAGKCARALTQPPEGLLAQPCRRKLYMYCFWSNSAQHPDHTLPAGGLTSTRAATPPAGPTAGFMAVSAPAGTAAAAAATATALSSCSTSEPSSGPESSRELWVGCSFAPLALPAAALRFCGCSCCCSPPPVPALPDAPPLRLPDILCFCCCCSSPPGGAALLLLALLGLPRLSAPPCEGRRVRGCMVRSLLTDSCEQCPPTAARRAAQPPTRTRTPATLPLPPLGLLRLRVKGSGGPPAFTGLSCVHVGRACAATSGGGDCVECRWADAVCGWQTG